MMGSEYNVAGPPARLHSADFGMVGRGVTKFEWEGPKTRTGAWETTLFEHPFLRTSLGGSPLQSFPVSMSVGFELVPW